MYPYLLVGLGGAIGAMSRYGFSSLVTRFWTASFPLATLLINIIGSLLMGILVGVLARTLPQGQNEIRLFVAVGILGGFTTFSAFSLDAITLIERGEWTSAMLYALLSVVISVGALYLGLMITRGAGA
jgi:fluoride exporter